MKYQIKIENERLIDVNNFCATYGLELDIDNMTIDLLEVHTDGR